MDVKEEGCISSDFAKAVAQLCAEDGHQELVQYGWLPPSRKISPLLPFLSLREYEMLERDRGKYMLYWRAISLASKRLTKERQHSQNNSCFVSLVFGAGLGRLVSLCLDAFHEHNLDFVVHAVDANPLSVEILRKSFHGLSNVVVHDSFLLHPAMQKEDLSQSLRTLYGRCDLCVSELLGCFADDEFLAELMPALYKLFLKQDGVMIPESWNVFAVPFSSPEIRRFLTANDKPVEAVYTCGMPGDCVLWSLPETLWSGHYRSCDDLYSGKVRFSIELSGESFSMERSTQSSDSPAEKLSKEKVEQAGDCEPVRKFACVSGQTLTDDSRYIHGFLGYFTCKLYDDVVIDSRHTSPMQNAFHWEAMLFPLHKPIPLPLPPADSLHLELELRRCRHPTKMEPRSISLWYEWSSALTVKEKVSEPGFSCSGSKTLYQTIVHNADGCVDSSFLQWPLPVEIKKGKLCSDDKLHSSVSDCNNKPSNDPK